MSSLRRSLLPALLALALVHVVAAQSANEQAQDKGIVVETAPAAAFLVLYLTATVVQWCLWFRHGMTLGFLLRVKNNYAWQFLFTFLSPCAFLAHGYVVLKHIAKALDREVSSACLFIPARGLVYIFVLSDVVTFMAQTAGTALVIIGGKWLSLGEKLAISGLALALASFSLFTVLLVVFTKRIRARDSDVYFPRTSTRRSTFNPWSKEPVDDLRTLLVVLGLTCIAILVRSVFRLIEHFFGYIATHEAYLYAFDSTPLWLGMALFCVVWPPRHVAGLNAQQDPLLLSERGHVAPRGAAKHSGGARARGGAGLEQLGGK
ncbi:uncharacterized protein RHOBADRAFT_47559 [Rhodotorula graminis WP1]|uniref:Uncharacterized protein n=1 Tax=Rhodotorula graminis (strain WP1) TaxID=578459 RepID=A0A0N8PZ83_RHOGW|nr:uncharacterized protein RHOBADRAFT_47559 [Rhodotorula graminis WP1]KPV71605.1 hypothetical protein RHOBADRAFT_47559 [Rhodotorula graminis WP1]